MKVDLHVHSMYSSKPSKSVLGSIGTPESYTRPQEVYDMCKNRGMDLVTITDHDAIDGALEIAHLPGTFISEEITTVFPEDSATVHVVALDISEKHHLEIKRLKDNIYLLVDYLRESAIPHYAAHPLYGPKGVIAKEHVQKIVLLFEHLEGKNGTLDEQNSWALKQMIDKLTLQDIEHWANAHQLEPVTWRSKRYLTGGSDDHGGLGMARTYTEFQSREMTVEEMRKRFFAGELRPGGEDGSGKRFCHGVYATTLKFFQSTGANSAFNTLLNESGDNRTSTTQRISSVIQGAVGKAMANAPHDLMQMVSSGFNGARDHDHLGALGSLVIRETYRKFVDELIDAVENMDVEKGIEAIPGILTATSIVLPYLFGYRHSITAREEALRIAVNMGTPSCTNQGCRIAVFNDVNAVINGVSIGLGRLTEAMRLQGIKVHVAACSENEDELSRKRNLNTEVVMLPSIRDFRVPFYHEATMGIPSLVDVLEFIDREKISVVQVSTPGPLGLTALLAAKICGLKVVANYHTELVKYYDILSEERSIKRLVSQSVAWFYRQADWTIVPSKSVIPSLLSYGVARETIQVVRRGVDARMFSPRHRDESIWEQFEASSAAKILYVGRVSKEKGLDVLLGAFDLMCNRGIEAELIIVGDGAYKEALQSKWSSRNIHFLGYRTGQELSKIFASSDVFAFPSETDTFGNVVLEAQASGLPVVVVDKGGPAEQVTPDKNGFVVPAGNVNTMAFALAKLCLDRELRELYGAEGRKRALTMTHEESAKAHFEFYKMVWSVQLEKDQDDPSKVTPLRPVKSTPVSKTPDDNASLNIG